MFKEIINSFLQLLLPSKLYLKLLVWKRGFEEPELKLVYEFCNKDGVSIDIGAANGLYLAHLFRISKKVYAFEPRKDAIINLKKVFDPITSSIQFEEVALSDKGGSAEFKFLKGLPRLSTLESENKIERFGKVEVVKVNVKKLDDYQFSDKVAFVKVDVEGHEEAVLRGAINLIREHRPVLLIEIEERHKKNAVKSVENFLSELGYKGFFFFDGFLHDIKLFELEKHQDYSNPQKPYIFNFIFINVSSIDQFGHLFKRPDNKE